MAIADRRRSYIPHCWFLLQFLCITPGLPELPSHRGAVVSRDTTKGICQSTHHLHALPQVQVHLHISDHRWEREGQRVHQQNMNDVGYSGDVCACALTYIQADFVSRSNDNDAFGQFVSYNGEAGMYVCECTQILIQLFIYLFISRTLQRTNTTPASRPLAVTVCCQR